MKSRPNTDICRLLGIVFAVFYGFALIGCGDSEPSDATKVDPPEMQSSVDTADSSGSSTGINGGSASANEMGDSQFEMPPLGVETGNTESTGIELPPGIQAPAATDSGSLAPAATEVRYASWSEIESGIRSSGKVTVVDFWSLTCVPCIKEFPGLVALHQQHQDKIQCIGFDVDFDGRKSRPPETYYPQVTEFLQSVNATFPNYISNTANDEVYSEVGIVTLPAVLVFGADGSLIKKFTDTGETAGFTYDKDIAPLVGKLLG